MSLNDIVNVVITRQTQTVTEQGFGTPLVLGTSNHFTDLIRFYASMDEVAVDFSPTDPEYIAAQDIFSQVISPNLIAIGRRLVNNVTIAVETAMSAEDYVLNINGNLVTTTSNSSATYSIVTLDADLVPGNRIAVSVNGTGVGTVTSVITFDQDFVSGNIITPRLNNVNMTPVNFTTNQATTIAAVAAMIATNAAVTGGGSATVTDTNEITVVFNAAGSNTVNSVITSGTGAFPIATIDQGGFVYTTSFENTMDLIATAIEALPNIDSATVNVQNPRILTVIGPQNTSAVVNSFVVTGGASQAVATITNPLQPETAINIATAIVEEVNDAADNDPDFPVTATDNADGTFTLVNRFPGTAWTLETSTTIADPNRAKVSVTQVSPSTDYTVYLNNIPFTFRTPVNIQNSSQIATALVALIDLAGSNFPVGAEDNLDGTFQVYSKNSTEVFSIRVTPEIMTYQQGLIVAPLVAVNPVATDLDLINDADNTWYALIATTRDPTTVLAIAAWVEARIKLFGTASSDTTIINVQAGTDTTSIAAKFGQLGYVRSFVMYHQDANYDYPEAAWFGRVLPLEPGSETWKFKTLATIAYSNLTTTQSRNAQNKNANTYEFVGGVGITANGTVAQGEFIDTIRGIDWLTARIQEFVFSVLVNNPKVPYTDAGIAAIQAEVLRALTLAQANNFLTENPAPVCTVPKAADVPPTDKANRILRNVRFTATLAGAIHAVEIRGTVSV